MDEHKPNLCPECNGEGWDEYYQGYDSQPYYEFCPACNGDGVIDGPVTEEETAQSAYTLAGGKLHAERDPRHGRDVPTFAWPIPAR